MAERRRVHHKLSVVLNHLSKRRNCVVLSSVELTLLHLLLGGLLRHVDVDTVLERGQANLRDVGEEVAAVLGNDTNSVHSSLANACRGVGCETADGLDDLHVVGVREVGLPEVLDHVVEYKERKLESLLVLARKGRWQNHRLEFYNKLSAVVAVVLEENAH